MYVEKNSHWNILFDVELCGVKLWFRFTLMISSLKQRIYQSVEGISKEFQMVVRSKSEFKKKNHSKIPSLKPQNLSEENLCRNK